ncbi:hypothetical protein [Rossellomorea marisflavi]|uniref:hypothetical protein n=1 Tax=Rossellomorea marisflavi TaxID=189381 RepID=UPI003F9FF36C
MKGLLFGFFIVMMPLAGCSGEIPVIQDDEGTIAVTMKPEKQDVYIAKSDKVANEVMKLTTEMIQSGNDYVKSPETHQMLKEKAKILLNKVEDLQKKAMDENANSPFAKDLAHVQKQFNQFLVTYEKTEGKMDRDILDGLNETTEGKEQLDKTLQEIDVFTKTKGNE